MRYRVIDIFYTMEGADNVPEYRPDATLCVRICNPSNARVNTRRLRSDRMI